MIIGISGHARTGKDTLGNYLIKFLKSQYNRTFVKAAFADKLKEMCQSHFGLSYDQLWGDKKEIPDSRYKKNNKEYWTPREIMQNVGNFYRSIDYDFWVKCLDNYLKSNDIKDVIITDVRYRNECDYIRNNGGLLIRVKRENADEIHGMTHESETALDNEPITFFDIEIDNSGSLESLHTIAQNISNVIITLEKMVKKGGIYNGKEE